MHTLRGKRALVTGAASGIGKAIALRLAREGCDVALVDIQQEALEAATQEVAAMSVRTLSLRCDVAKCEQIADAVRELLARWNGLELLVNNAGVVHFGPTESMSAELWDKLLAINLRAPIEFLRLLLPTLLKQPEAHIVNVASMYGLFATRKSAAYHATKFGLVGLSEALRAEYGRLGIGVTCVCPGFVPTNLFQAGTTGLADKDVPQPPAWLCTTAEHVAEKTVRGIYRDRRLVLVSWLAYGMYYLKRAAPWLLDWAQHWGRRKSTQKRWEKIEKNHC